MQLKRVREICATMPSATEKLSHGAPSFFAEKDKKVFLMFVDSHHQDGRLAVWVPAPSGMQAELINDAPATYFKPPYVGSSGWIGILLPEVSDETLAIHVREAWQIVTATKKKARRS